MSKQAAYIVTDILAGNTDMKVNPFWGEHAIYDGGRRRPAAYKTGTTSDNKDVAALRLPGATEEPEGAGARRRHLDGQQRQHAERRQALARYVRAAVGRDPDRHQPRHARSRSFKPPAGLQTATVDAFTGLKPGPFTTKTVKELFIKGTIPTQRETSRVAKAIDAASGLLWQEGCVGPKVTEGFFNMAEVEAGHPTWQKADRNWANRAARGVGVRGGSKGTKTAYFYGSGFYPFGRSWGAKFAPTELCPLAPGDAAAAATRCCCRLRRRRARRSSRSPGDGRTRTRRSHPSPDRRRLDRPVTARRSSLRPHLRRAGRRGRTSRARWPPA